jgi:hypothetical protein
MKNAKRNFLGTAAALLAALAVSAPGAAAAPLEFEPETVYANAHAPADIEPPFALGGQGIFGFPIGYDEWAEMFGELPEVTQAGGHPDYTTRFEYSSGVFSGPDETPKDLVAEQPAGAVGNPLSVPRCESADFFLTVLGNCPTEAQIGVSGVNTIFQGLSPVYSLVPPPGEPSLIAFKSILVTVILYASVRSDGDYGLRVEARNIFPGVTLLGNTLTLWGVPHDPVHDIHRIDRDTSDWGGSVSGVPRPFLTAPTDCDTGPVPITLRSRSWETPEHWTEDTDTAAEATGCEQIEFEPELEARPSTNVADSPSGLEFDLEVPQNEDCVLIPESEAEEEEMLEDGEPVYDCGLATSHLKDTTVTLPEGFAINPSSANGLDGCSLEEANLVTGVGETPVQSNGEPAECPDASKIAEVEVDTPLLDQPLKGGVHIADPHKNPFESLLALYIAVDDKQTGITATLAGEVQADSETGQLTASFEDNPQLPFENFRISFKQGPHAPLRTPAVCGDYETDADFVPYSAPNSSVSSTDEWEITSGHNGSCANDAASQPHAPAFDAGTITPIAGAESPFVMQLKREDGSQNFGAVTIDPPPGLLAKLAGTQICPDAFLAAAAAKDGAEEKASPSCPATSRLGSVVAGAGAGPSPYYAPGTIYLAGPYKGAPLSLAIVAPATAGPFDLGTVVNRIAAYIDPRTAQITAVSDPLPTILEGIPLDIRTVDVALDRPSFTRNPTSCDPMAVGGLLTSTQGALAPLSSRFQVAECGQLGFKPKMFLRLFGKRFSRGANPRLRAVIVPRTGDANISRIAVKMPSSLFLDQSHIRTVCTRVQFAADACPPGAVYGKVIAQSPLVDYPLTGNVYLRSSDNKLPDLVADLRGPAHQPVRIEGVGRTDSVKGALRNTFDIVPDAPVTKVVLLLQAGNKSLLVASRNLCKGDQRARVNLTAHNGRQLLINPKIRIPCRKQRKAKGKARRRQSKAALAHGSAAG